MSEENNKPSQKTSVFCMAFGNTNVFELYFF